MKPIYRAIALSCIAAGMAFSSADALAWGQKGHDVTCAVAERHLSKKAKKQISEILDGKSIVYWANWMDNASNTPEYAYTKTWHYRDVDENESYENLVPEESGDVLTAIESQVKALKSGTLNKEAQALALKMIVHFVGDLHCPMHMGHKTDLGGNRWQVQYFNEGKNLHSVWDSGLIESAHKWTYTEWADQIDRVSEEEFEAITAGTPLDWGKDAYEAAKAIYAETPVGTKMSYGEVSRWSPVVEQQLLRGGLRLAKLLNEIFR